MSRVPEHLVPVTGLSRTASGLTIAPADFRLPDPTAQLNGAGHLVLPDTEIGRTATGLLVVGGMPEIERRRAPTHRLVFINDFSFVERDDRSPNQCINKYRKVCTENGVEYVEPLAVDSGVYALRPINAAYLNDLYAREYENSEEQRVHVVVCDPGVGSAREGIVVKTKKATYVGPNNGVFWRVIEREGLAIGADGQLEVYKIKDGKFHGVKTKTFHGKEVFIPVAAEIASGKDPSQLFEWLEREKFDPEKLVQLPFEENQVLEIDGFNLIRINGKMPDDNPTHARVTVIDREAGEQQESIVIPTDDTFNGEKGQLIIYPGSDGLLEIAACHAVHRHENNAVKQFSFPSGRPIEPGHILDIEWKYGRDLAEGVEAVLTGKN